MKIHKIQKKDEESKKIILKLNILKNNNKLILSGKEIEKGTSVTLNIELPKLYQTHATLPINVIRGKKDGPINKKGMLFFILQNLKILKQQRIK